MSYSPLAVERELRRLGVDLARLRGLATRGLAPEDFLRWLRTLPGGIGHEAFVGRLDAPPDAGGPRAPEPDEPEASDVATFGEPAAEELGALVAEIDRVVPPAARPPTLGLNFPRGRAHALAALRALPDGAGIHAVVRALESAAGDEHGPAI